MAQTAVETKHVTLVMTRPRRDIPVEVLPSDSASDVLNKAGLNQNDYALLKPSDQSEFTPTEQVWKHVDDGGKLHVVPVSHVG